MLGESVQVCLRVPQVKVRTWWIIAINVKYASAAKTGLLLFSLGQVLLATVRRSWLSNRLSIFSPHSFISSTHFKEHMILERSTSNGDMIRGVLLACPGVIALATCWHCRDCVCVCLALTKWQQQEDFSCKCYWGALTYQQESSCQQQQFSVWFHGNWHCEYTEMLI